MIHKNTLSFFSFFIVFLLIFTSFLIVNIEAKTDYHIEYAGGVPSLEYVNNEHIVMNENGDELGIAFIGKNGDSTYVNFQYRDMPECIWCEKSIRQTINITSHVAIARDSDFNIYALYSEGAGGTREYLFYKKFDWSTKTWNIPEENMGLNLTFANTWVNGSFDIKVALNGDIHVVWDVNYGTAPVSEQHYRKYDFSAGTWGSVATFDNEVTDYPVFSFGNLALDSNSNIYYIYGKKQTGHWDKEHFYDMWFIKSIDNGDSWSSPSQIINATYPTTVVPNKLIIDNSNRLHVTYYQNYTGNWNQVIGYKNSIDYGVTWSDGLNISTDEFNSADASLSFDNNNILYFVYYKRPDYNYTVNGYGNLYGKKYENNILGDEIQITTDDNVIEYSPSLVFSNTYNQYADSGIIGIYEDRRVANLDIRYLEMDYNDFLLGQYNLRIIPVKPIYYTFDVIKTYVDNPTNRAVAIRFLNATGVKVEPMGTHGFASGTDWYAARTIPSMYGSGIWRVQASPYTEGQAIIWGVAGTEYLNFTVQDSGLDYFITAYPSWVIRNNYVSFDFSAKAGEMYRIELWNPYPFGGGGYGIGNITTTTYGIDQTVVYQYGFLMVDDGSYSLNLYNATSGDKIAFSNSFHVGSEPEDNTYSVAIADRYKYTDRPKITISRWGSQNYEYHVYNENNIQIASGTSGLSEHEFTLYMTASDVGTAYIRVYNLGHTPSDSNAVYIEFQIYDPDGLTGDPIIDTFISIPTWIKAIVGVMIVLGFVFIPFILSQYIAGNHKLDVPPVIYAICGGIGVTLCTLLGLFGWEIMFFICVIAGISLVISYVWQQKGD